MIGLCKKRSFCNQFQNLVFKKTLNWISRKSKIDVEKDYCSIKTKTASFMYFQRFKNCLIKDNFGKENFILYVFYITLLQVHHYFSILTFHIFLFQVSSTLKVFFSKSIMKFVCSFTFHPPRDVSYNLLIWTTFLNFSLNIKQIFY